MVPSWLAKRRRRHHGRDHFVCRGFLCLRARASRRCPKTGRGSRSVGAGTTAIRASMVASRMWRHRATDGRRSHDTACALASRHARFRPNRKATGKRNVLRHRDRDRHAWCRLRCADPEAFTWRDRRRRSREAIARCDPPVEIPAGARSRKTGANRIYSLSQHRSAVNDRRLRSGGDGTV